MLRLTVFSLFFLAQQVWAVDFGKPDVKNDWRDVVALTQATENPNQFQVFCSGVVIHENIVLTAAHCLQDGGIRLSAAQLKEKVKNLRIHFGQGSEESVVSTGLVEVERAVIHPAYLRDIRGQADVAILILKSPAPIEKKFIRPLALETSLLKQRIRRGSPLTIVGFGYSEQLGSTPFSATKEIFGAKHIGIVQIEGKTADEVQIVPGVAVDRFGLYRPAPREGDSGGPAFYLDQNGTYYLTGVVSRATKFNHGPRGVAYSLLRNWVCWIEKESNVRLRPDDSTPDYCSMGQPNIDANRVANVDFYNLCEEPADLSSAYTFHVLKEVMKAVNCRDLDFKLKNTTNLNLDATYINNLLPLAGLPHLQRLSVRDNLIQSVTPLIHHQDLAFLDISYNNVKDVSNLQQLEQDKLWLVGRSRQYHNIGRTNFIRLCHSDQTEQAAKKTIEAIIDMFNMRERECVNANYELIRLRQLSFYQVSGLTDMTPLEGLHTLEELDLSGQKVNSLNFLYAIDDLRKLTLDGNPVADLSPILRYKNLRELSLKNMGLKDLDLIAQLPRLKVLDISGNHIQDFSLLEDRIRRGILSVIGRDQQTAN